MNPALFAKVKGQATGERIKTLIKKAENLVVEALSNSLKPLMVAIEGNFEYYQSTPNGKLNWEDAIEIMEQYLLDSSDATILNFAIKMGFDGLATCDGDFKRVDNVQGFTIYMPKALLSTK
jgi:predicted nucleic acid-binding protein